MRISRKHYKDAYKYIYLEVKLINHNNLCIQNNKNAEFVNLEIDKYFKKWYSPFIIKFSQSIAPFDCELKPLEVTKIITK